MVTGKLGKHRKTGTKIDTYPDFHRAKEIKRDHTTDELQQFKHTTASKKPKYALIPKEALDALAARFELGTEKHKEKAWNALSNQQGLLDEDWIIARAEHVIHHAMLFIQKMKGIIPDDGDDDAAAIMWGGTCLFEAKRKTHKKADKR